MPRDVETDWKFDGPRYLKWRNTHESSWDACRFLWILAWTYVCFLYVISRFPICPSLCAGWINRWIRKLNSFVHKSGSISWKSFWFTLGWPGSYRLVVSLTQYSDDTSTKSSEHKQWSLENLNTIEIPWNKPTSENCFMKLTMYRIHSLVSPSESPMWLPYAMPY